MSRPLDGVRIVELAAQGPAPFAGSLLGDFGADVIVIDRPPDASVDPATSRKFDFYMRNKRSIALDLKSQAGRKTALDLISRADVLIEGYRPGVAERLGLGPADCASVNPRLVYARMTGWGQEGPMAQEAGHDINYLALTGALHSIGPADSPPPPPLNLVADLGGGGMFLVMGILMALRAAESGGEGQVVDCAMIDGVAQLMSAFQAFRQEGSWIGERQANIVDGGAPWYGTYETADGKYVAVGAIEPKFYDNLVRCLGLSPESLPDRSDRSAWPAHREAFAKAFSGKTRAEWEAVMAGQDACFSPVLTIDESWEHPQMQARQTFRTMNGLAYPSPAPRLSRTPGTLVRPAPEPGSDGAEILASWGLAGGQEP